ncbi:MAG TPA: DUF2783 domain-containing protein [Burkholderiales bacterium]|nr:DUF2783 domain-containing protein [Burkholderiales bacterium]
MQNTLSESELDQAYDLIATAIDRVGRTDESLFLAKLCLALSAQLRSVGLIVEAIRAAEQELRG